MQGLLKPATAAGGIALLLSRQLTMLACLGSYTAWRHRQLAGSDWQTWHGWSWEALAGWGPFLQLDQQAAPAPASCTSSIMMCLEW